MSEGWFLTKLKTEVVSVEDEESEGNEVDKEKIPFFPDHVVSETTVSLLVLCLILVLCIFFPANLGQVADPMKTPTGAKPDWYFLFLYVFLRLVPPSVAALVPLGGVALLFLLPFLDKNPERVPRGRLLALSFCTVLLATLVALTVVGYLIE